MRPSLGMSLTDDARTHQVTRHAHGLKLCEIGTSL